MNEFGEENTIPEILAYWGIHGEKARRMSAHFRSWISAQSSTLQYSPLYVGNPRSKEAIRNFEGKLIADISPTWTDVGPGGDAA